MESGVVIDQKIRKQYDYLVTELEASDSSIASTLREVFESDRPDDHKAFVETLSRRLTYHHGKIVKICSNNYSLFSSSVSQLVKLCPNIGKLQMNIDRISIETTHAIEVVTKNQENFRKSVNSCRNVIMTRSAIEDCLPVLRMHSNVTKMLKKPEMHYHALKMLEELDKKVLPNIENKFKFCQKLRDDLKRCRKEINEELNKCFKSYLESALSNAKRIGCNAMKVVVHTSEEYKQQQQTSRLTWRSPSKADNGGTNSSGSSSALTHSKYTWELVDDTLGSVEEVINFKDLFQSQLIFNTLYKEDDGAPVGNNGSESTTEDIGAFSKWYETHRRDQLSQLLQHGFGSHKDSSCNREKISDFFEQLVGFFIIESYVVQTNKKIINWHTIVRRTCPSFVGWWDWCVSEIETKVCEESLSKIKIVEDLKYLKEILLLFCHTIESMSPLPCHKLKQCAFKIRHVFVNKLNEAFLRRFITVLWKDAYVPVVVTSESKLNEIRKTFPINYLQSTKGKCEIGKSLPFSECVPKIYFTLKEFVTELLSFCNGFTALNSQVLEEFLAKSVDGLIENQLKPAVLTLIASMDERKGAQRSKYLPSVCSRGTLDFGELSQLSSNCECLSESMTHLATYMAISHSNGATFSTSNNMNNIFHSGDAGQIRNLSNYNNISGNRLLMLAAVDPVMGLDNYNLGGGVLAARSHGHQGPFKLNASSTLTSLVFDVQYRMREYMKFKIDAIFELIQYNWTTEQALLSPSDYVTEVTSYLKNVRLTNKNTQSNVVAVTTYMEACKHISERMRSELLSANEISLVALKTFDRDLTCFENFTAQLEFPPSDAETLRLVFTDLRQLVDVILKKEFEKYISSLVNSNSFSDSGSNVKLNTYNRVRREELLQILEKMLSFEEHRRGGGVAAAGASLFSSTRLSSVVSGSPDSRRNWKRSLENGVKELRSVISASSVVSQMHPNAQQQHSTPTKNSQSYSSSSNTNNNT